MTVMPHDSQIGPHAKPTWGGLGFADMKNVDKMLSENRFFYNKL